MMITVTTPADFLRHNHDELQSILKSLLYDKDRVQDLSQMFYVKLPTILCQYNPTRSKFSSYIYQCVRNMVYSQLNMEKRRRTSMLTDDITHADSGLDIRVRIDDFRRHCVKHGLLGTERVLAELDNRIQDATTASCFSGTYKNYLQAFLEAGG